MLECANAQSKSKSGGPASLFRKIDEADATKWHCRGRRSDHALQERATTGRIPTTTVGSLHVVGPRVIYKRKQTISSS